MESPGFKIVIVGGGIAGLAAAIALRAPGREIVVLEQSRLNREIGALISLQPNASKIIEKWGIAERLVECGSMTDKGFRIFSTDGVLRTQVLAASNKFGGDRVIYHRQDLHDTLREAATSMGLTGTPAIIKTGSRVVDCDCQSGVVTLENGEELQGDIIIGADGIHSVIRKFVLGKELSPVPTGLSAYRMLVDTEDLQRNLDLTKFLDPTDSWTTMIWGHKCRIVMGPGRSGKVYGIVALVPDEFMHEDSSKSSWTTAGSLEDLLESFKEFPEYTKQIFRASPSLGLWQLRDLDPLSTWVKGRTILIGDAAHPMLPTQGQGASQSIEDAEALAAFFENIDVTPSSTEVNRRLMDVFNCRYTRASLIQAYSRDQARPATAPGSSEITLYPLTSIIPSDRRNPVEFADYNWNYDGAKDWAQRQKTGVVQ